MPNFKKNQSTLFQAILPGYKIFALNERSVQYFSKQEECTVFFKTRTCIHFLLDLEPRRVKITDYQESISGRHYKTWFDLVLIHSE